jgi:thiol:disulfide interchange protein DsbC
VTRSIFIGISLLSSLLTAVPSWADSDTDKLKQKLSSQLPEFHIDDISPSPVSGLYEVTVGGETVYTTADGKYMFTGDLVEVATRVNLTESKRGKRILAAIEHVGEKNMIVMGPDKPKRTITVFTDVDCPYCAKLHKDVPQLIKAGIKVRYLLYPRSGVDGETYKRSVAVWCAKDRVKAVGIAKAGGALEMKTCDNPVAANFQLGQSVGITGTPTIVLDNGRVLPGYIPADKLLAGLEQGGGKK